MREKKYQPIAEEAERVLRRNDRGTYTVPAGDMYGKASWLWDSAFTVEGIRHYDPQRAAKEIDQILDAQWQNGMVPHMRFYRGLENRLMWASRRHPLAHRHITTSGMTQPPLAAEAIRQASEKLNASDRLAFIRKNFSRVVAYHEWIYRERNLNGEGLFTAVHPWETGMDNSPVWMHHMESIDWGLAGKTIRALSGAFQSFRTDVKHAPKNQLASTADSAVMLSSFLKLRKYRYDYKRLADNYPLHLEDVHMTSILIRNNVILEELSDEYKLPIPDHLRTQMALSRTSLEKYLWDEQTGLYYPRDAVTKQQIKIPAIASLMPIYAGSPPQDRLKRLVGHLDDTDSFNQPYGTPTVPVNSEYYDEHCYWKGPVWFNVEKLLIRGLRRNHYFQQADRLTQAGLDRAEKSGFYEYASAKTGEGLGAKNFSWTAAVVLDLIKSDKHQIV